MTYRSHGLMQRLTRFSGFSADAAPPVVDGITLSIAHGETVALVGESGSGKSTIARTIAGALAPLSGSIHFRDRALADQVRNRSLEDRKRIQFVFQNPDASLNPRQTVRQILDRPLQLFSGLGRMGRRDRIIELLEEVRLPAEYLDRFPAQLSGGEKQRIAIARALAADPEIVLCDEVVSALDVSVQAAIIQLLVKLQETRGTAYFFVAHDLALVRSFADRVVVLYAGRLCEIGPADRVYAGPFHPYTAMLLAAAPSLDPMASRPRPPRSLVASPAFKGIGCAFAARCPRRINGVCDQQTPPWRHFGDDHVIRCHLSDQELQGNVSEVSVPPAGESG